MSFTAIAAVFLMLFPGLPSQARTPESVCGIVQDQTGAFVSGAALKLKTANTSLDTTTDASGHFCFRPLEPGEYELLSPYWLESEVRKAGTAFRPSETMSVNTCA
jgi:Carboxypeptidase regulatory-like domain